MPNLIVNLNTITFSAVQTLLFALYPYFAQEIGLSLSSIIFSFSLGSLMFLWSSPYWADKSDKLGRFRILSIGLSALLLSTAMLIFLVFFSSHLSSLAGLSLLILSRLIYGLFASAIIPVGQALQLDLAMKNEQLKSMLSNSMSLNIGRLLGPAYLLIFNTVSPILLITLCVWIFILIICNKYNERYEPNPHYTETTISEFKITLLDKNLKWVFLLAISFTALIGALQSGLSGHLTSLLEIDERSGPLLMAKLLCGSSILAIFIQLISKKLFKDPWQGPLILGAIALIFSGLGFFFAENLAQLLTSILVVSIAIAIIPPAYLTISSLYAPHLSRGKKIGLISSGNTVGYSVGGIFMAISLHFLPATSAFQYTLFGLAVICAIFVMLLQNKKEVKNE